MKILIACEESQEVCKAFRAKGHDAYSCDIQDCSGGHPEWHIKGDVLQHLDCGWKWSGHVWDMMIAFPPCTDLAVSGARWFPEKRANGSQQRSIDFFMALVNAPIKRIAIENPIGIMSKIYRKPDQIIQPWQFGHPESKATCLWLSGLPPLIQTEYADFKKYRCRCGYVFPENMGKYGCANCGAESGPAKPLWDNQTPSGQNKLGPSEHRAKERSKTYSGIAKAMAEQWV
jgi:hypothetical protein